MDIARWEHVQALFHEALEHPESQRQAFLETACGGDEEMRAEVATMLQADERSTSLLDRSLADVAYQMVGAPPESVSSREFGPYRLLRVLGEGGMGVVWLAERADTGNQVAIKFLPHAGLSPARRERFAREIKTLAKLRHPLIARLYDAGALADGTPWFVMEYVEGERFIDHCRREVRPVEERLRLFRSVCEAVQYAHGQEIIHRDLKPSNILVERDGSPRLLDFGIARELHNLESPAEATRPALRFVSPDYAAPEWLDDGTVGFYTDVYALGVILYELLAGELPFRRSGSPAQDAANYPAQGEPARPSVAAKRLGERQSMVTGVLPPGKTAWGDLDVLCLKALHRDARKRYQSVEALIRDIDHFLKREPLEARPDTWKYRAGKFVRRNRRAVMATAAALVLTAGLSAFYTVRLARARDTALVQAARAQRVQKFMFSMFAADMNSGPSEDLRVVTLLERAAQNAQTLDNEPAVQADLYENLGGSYENLGETQRAEPLLEKGLEKRKAAFGADSEEAAEGMVDLSLLRTDEARFDEAEGLARQAIAIDRRKRPVNRPALGIALSTFGLVLYHRGQYDEAIAVLEEAVNLQSALSAEQANLLESLTYLANVEHLAGHDLPSLPLYQRILAQDRAIYGDNTPSVAQDLDNLGQAKEALGRYAEAERDEREALRMMQAWYHKDDSGTELIVTSVAKTLVCQQKYDEALKLLRPALIAQQRNVGNTHPFVALIWNLLGVIDLKQGRLDESEKEFNEMLRIDRSLYGEKDFHTAGALARLGELAMARKQYPQAEQLFRRSVQIFSETLSANSFKTGVARTELGSALLQQQRYSEAQPELLAAYKIVTSESHASTEEAMNARRDLVALYGALNQPEKAATFRAELDANAHGQDIAAIPK